MAKKRKRGVYIENGLRCGIAWFPLLLIIPAVFNFILFWVVPNFNSILLSFQDLDGSWTTGNYSWVLQDLFSNSSRIFKVALRNTLTYFSVSYFVVQTFNVILAYFIYKKILFSPFFRFLLYMPNMFASIIMVSVYMNVMGDRGPIVELLYNIGFLQEKLSFFHRTEYAMRVSVGYSLWVGVNAVFLWSSGAMARIPKDLFEAASLDGITPFKEFVHIILPMISGTLSTLYIIGMSGILGAGGATLYLTYGEYETTTLSFWIWKQVYTGAGYGTSSALGIMMTAVSLPLIFFVKWLSGKLSAEVSY